MKLVEQSMNMDSWPIGVFASVDAGLGVAWDVIAQLKVPTIQLHAPSPEKRNQESAEAFREQLNQMGVRCTAVFGGFEGESYADIPTVVQTVGLVPADTRQSRLQEMLEISDFAHWLGCDTVALHLGFIPHDPEADGYADIVDVTRQLCDHCAGHQQFLHLETGQETAEGLLEFIKQVDRENLKINFDPANMILRDGGTDCILLVPIRSIHCRTGLGDQPEDLGSRVALGKGDVGMEVPSDKSIHGPLTIERPQDPERQLAEIGQAIELLTNLLPKCWAKQLRGKPYCLYQHGQGMSFETPCG